MLLLYSTVTRVLNPITKISGGILGYSQHPPFSEELGRVVVCSSKHQHRQFSVDFRCWVGMNTCDSSQWNCWVVVVIITNTHHS